MKRPSFQFYPADWRKDANLRRCSAAARGVWMDLLCLLHDSDQYGVVLWPLKELASAAGASLAHVRELVDKRVIKGCDQGECEPLIFIPRHGRKDGDPVTLIDAQPGPIWYSARFVRDEYVRTIRGESTRFGVGNGDAPKDAPIPPFGDGSTSSPSSSLNPLSDQPVEGTPLSKPPAKPSAPRAARLPKEWVLPKRWGEWALETRQDWTAETVRTVAENFRCYWIAKPGKDGLKLDWEATWQNWVRKESTTGGKPNGSQTNRGVDLAAFTGSTSGTGNVIEGQASHVGD